MVEIIVANGWTGAKAILGSSDSFKVLNIKIGDANPLTFHEGTTDYQVASGKTFTLLGLFVTQVDTAKTLTLFQNDAADTTDGTDSDKFQIVLPAGIDINSLNYVPLSGSIASQKFLNADVSSATGTEPNLTVVGVEA